MQDVDRADRGSNSGPGAGHSSQSPRPLPCSLALPNWGSASAAIAYRRGNSLAGKIARRQRGITPHTCCSRLRLCPKRRDRTRRRGTRRSPKAEPRRSLFECCSLEGQHSLREFNHPYIVGNNSFGWSAKGWIAGRMNAVATGAAPGCRVRQLPSARQQAVNALLAGVCTYAVVWRAMHNPRGTYQNLPGARAQGSTQFTAPYGFGGPGQGMAVAYTRWLERHNQNREKMATLAVTQRRHTQHNPQAYFYGTPLTREDYLNSRMVAYPFCLFDCDIPVQGAVAIVLTTADRARDLRPRPAYIAGYGQRLAFEVAGRIGSLSSYMEGGRSSSRLTWERSGFSPRDVDVAQIYDGFSASVIYGLESYGFCKEGEALDFIQDGRMELDGELPLNTFGGSLGTGRIHGLWHIIEGALQASGRAGERQVKDVDVSFVGASAPIVQGTTFIFVKEPY